MNNELGFKKIMRQLIYSVKCMHDLGIVHRDLKLDNILIQNIHKNDRIQSEIRIIDFGLTANMDQREEKSLNGLVGTPHYIAPEIVQGKYDEKCDIWALGVIAYQLFSQGEYPFRGANEV